MENGIKVYIRVIFEGGLGVYIYIFIYINITRVSIAWDPKER